LKLAKPGPLVMLGSGFIGPQHLADAMTGEEEHMLGIKTALVLMVILVGLVCFVTLGQMASL
jgi:hypothetical protein